MSTGLSALLGDVGAMAAGAAIALSGCALAARLLLARVSAAEARAQEASDRLYAAWKDGFAIPEAARPPEPVVVTRDPEVEEWLDQFDSTGQSVYRAKAERLFREGWSAPAVLAQLARERSALESPF